MRQFKITFLLTVLMSMVGVKTFSYDIQVDGIYYRLFGTEAAVINGSESYTGKVVIPEFVTYNGFTFSVTSIYNRAFYNCSGLTNVAIPNTVTRIGESAFEGCI